MALSGDAKWRSTRRCTLMTRVDLGRTPPARGHSRRAGGARLFSYVAAGMLGIVLNAGSHAASCPEVQWPQAPGEMVPAAPYFRLNHSYKDPAEMPLGVGHIRPDTGYTWGWHERIRLPLFSAPDGMPAGFIDRGWLKLTGNQHPQDWQPLGTAGMVETAYETPSFLVLQTRSDGWLQFRYAPPGREPDLGAAWLNECHLRNQSPRMRFEPWRERLLSRDISPLFFRKAVAHRLRARPGLGAPVLGIIAGDHHLEPMVVQGDWMRVVVKQPSDYCGDIPSRRRTGWVQWTSPATGPWVWYYTRGC